MITPIDTNYCNANISVQLLEETIYQRQMKKLVHFSYNSQQLSLKYHQKL